MSEPDTVDRLIIPTHEAVRLVSNAGAIFLRECQCRADIKACPPSIWDVCLLFEHAPEEDRKQARQISSQEAARIVSAASERGDIHELFSFHEGSRPSELCNCCTCCCSPLREAKQKGDYAQQQRSAYVAVTDAALCTGCETCVGSCFFEARRVDGAIVHLIDERCFGCGRCVASCPQQAVRLEFQPGRGVPIPNLPS